MAYWLFKSEPDVFSWDHLVQRGAAGEPWDGVRNYLARNNMRAMQLGDLGFFYHSNEGREVVGICEVCALAHPDPTDDTGKWECVDVRAVTPFPTFVTLADVKANPRLAKMNLVTSMRLSVQPVLEDEWIEVCRMGGLDGSKFRSAGGAGSKLGAAKAKPAAKAKAKPAATFAGKAATKKPVAKTAAAKTAPGKKAPAKKVASAKATKRR